MSVPRPPAGMGTPGRALWRSVLRDFDLGAREQLVLLQACHVADVCGRLQEVIDADGPMLVTADGAPRTHPACRELRQQRITLARLIVCLRVPLGAEDGRTQYRGMRGAYPLRGAP
ncbi:MAG TPA: hypothetical protein VMU94_28450 [Streptosporangiaceae bacterium]|nr:hypothetical protein [Streptosporangiaceae bacterium]